VRLPAAAGGGDRYGNLLTIKVSQCPAPSLPVSVNANNQITNSGFSHDASGDVTNDGQEGYSWDAEGHVASTSGSYPDTFEYDGGGWKVYQSSGTLYWRAPDGYA
jgi:hypothetical protein